MHEDEYRWMARGDANAWWFRARRRILARVVRRLGLPDGARIADIGCGTGGNLRMLAEHGDAMGVDRSELAASLARQRSGAPVLVGDAAATGLPGGAFHLATLLDVLEHVPEEGAVLAEVRRILRPGGWVLVTVPAFPFLWGGHDERLHHLRRYHRRELAGALETAGFEVAWSSYYNTALFAPTVAVRLARRALGRDAGHADGAKPPPGLLNRALEGVFATERWLVGRVPLPFGVSVVALARSS